MKIGTREVWISSIGLNLGACMGSGFCSVSDSRIGACMYKVLALGLIVLNLHIVVSGVR